MREILFRGKRLYTMEWVEGYVYRVTETQNPPFLMLKDFHAISYEVYSDSIGQYTGLKDKNDQMIFEGDLVQPVLPPSISQPSFVWPIMPVVFSDGVFGLQDQRGGVTPFKSFAPRVTFEVMGNIHDNPELLKGE